MVNKKDELIKLPTGSKIIDDLLGGGVSYGMLTSICGEPMTGKSWYSYQIGINNIKVTDKETLLIDTEGIKETELFNILNKIRVRFDVDEEKIKSKFKMIKTYDDPNMMSIQKLMQMFGYMVRLELSDVSDKKKGGKYKVTFQHCDETLTKKQLQDTSMIILDSFTKPIKDSIGSETANLPARAQIMERLFSKLYQIADIYDIAIMVNHHMSIPPMAGQRKAYGGNTIFYNSKYVLELYRGTKSEQEIKCGEDKRKSWDVEARRISLVRHPSIQSTGDKIPIRLMKDMGFVDS